MDHSILTLSNGIRILFNPARSGISHACVVIGTGSRDEAPGKAGLAHFIEHMLFKGTERRNTSQVLNRLELVGADLNAYTTKEYTCVHASFLRPHLARALDLFEDILFHSTFPETEIEKEKGVVIDEINSYRDQPEDAIFDEYEELLFGDHPLGKNILGDPETVTSFRRPDILSFITENYRASSIVIGVSGDYKESWLLGICERFFGAVRPGPAVPLRLTAPTASPGKVVAEKPVTQAHCVTGARAYDLYHPNRVGLMLLNNLLGGPGMSSRLNLEVREKQGIAYTIESNFTPFSDTGIFSIYFGTDPGKTERALRIIHRELKKLRDTAFGPRQIEQARQRFLGQIALGEESRMGLVIALAKSVLDYGYADSFDEVVKKVNGVSSLQLREIAAETLDPANFTTLLFVPGDD